MGSFQFQIAPRSSLHFSISTGPFRWSVFSTGVLICCTVPSEAKFVYLASACRSLQCLISTLTQAGGGGLLFRLLVPSRCFPRLRCSGSRLLYVVRALRCERFQPSGVPQKRGPSSSGSRELDARTLPRCGAPSPLRGPSLSFRRRQLGVCAFCPPRPQLQSPPAPVGCLRPVSSRDPPGGCRPSRISGGLWLETGGLFAVR